MWEHLLMLFMGDSLPYTLSTPSYNIHTLIIHWQDFQMELEKTTFFTMLWKNESNKCSYCSKANTRTRQSLQCCVTLGWKTKDKGVYSVHWNSKHKSAHPVLVNLYVHTCHEWDKWDIQNCYPLHRTTHKASSFCFETPRHKSDKLLITVTVPYWTISHVWRNPCIDYKRVDIVTNC